MNSMEKPEVVLQMINQLINVLSNIQKQCCEEANFSWQQTV